MLVDRVSCGACTERRLNCSYNLAKFAVDHDRLVDAGLLEPAPLDTPIDPPRVRVNFPAGGVAAGASSVGPGPTAPFAFGGAPAPSVPFGGAPAPSTSFGGAPVGPPVVGTAGWWAQWGQMAAQASSMGLAPPPMPAVGSPQATSPIVPSGLSPLSPQVPLPVAPVVRPQAPGVAPVRPSAGDNASGGVGPVRTPKAPRGSLQAMRDRAEAAERNLRVAQQQLESAAAGARAHHAEVDRSLGQAYGHAQRVYERVVGREGVSEAARRRARDDFNQFVTAFEQVAEHGDRLRMASDVTEATQAWFAQRRDAARRRRRQWEDRDRAGAPGRDGQGEGGSAPGGSGGGGGGAA